MTFVRHMTDGLINLLAYTREKLIIDLACTMHQIIGKFQGFCQDIIEMRGPDLIPSMENRLLVLIYGHARSSQ